MKNTNENNPPKKPINFQSLGNAFLLIIVVLILGNALLIFYLVNSADYSQIANEIVENTTSQELETTDTIANLLNNVVPLSNTSEQPQTVNSTDANSRKVMNEDLIVLYNGLILDTTKMDNVDLKYIDNNSTDKDKYVITYYNYENYAKGASSLGKLSSPVYDGLVKIENVQKIAISESYEAIPREVKVVNSLPTVVLENNEKLVEYDSVKVIIADLDGNGADEYILILANKTTGYSKISLCDSSGKMIEDLAYIEKSKWNTTTNIEYYLSLDNVNIIDVDNDNVMEILIEIPKASGESSVSLLKYQNSQLDGKVNIECSLLP